MVKHSICLGGIPIHAGKGDDWYSKGSKRTTVKKRKRNIEGKQYLEVDECSMMTKDMLALVSEVLSKEKSHNGENGGGTLPFGGMSVILFGDFHQFPPVGNSTVSLYDSRTNEECSNIGKALYQLFTTVITLVKQNQVQDEEWITFLNCLRVGTCTAEDLKNLDRLVVDHKEDLDFSCPPWKDAILVMSRHGPKDQWNAEALCRHCHTSGQ